MVRGRILLQALLVVSLAVAAGSRNAVWHDGLVLWEDAAAKSPRIPRVLYNLAVEYHAAGRVPEALDLIRSLLPAREADGLVLSELASLLADLGLLDDALRWSERAITAEPRNAKVWTGHGIIHQRRMQWEQATKAYERALEIMPQEFVALINLANVYDELGQDRDADRTYQAIIAFYPEAPEGYFNWGVYHERRGRIGTAKDLYRKALQVDESYQRAAERISILADDGPRALKPLTRP